MGMVEQSFEVRLESRNLSSDSGYTKGDLVIDEVGALVAENFGVIEDVDTLDDLRFSSKRMGECFDIEIGF